MGIIRDEIEKIYEHKLEVNRFGDSLTTVPYDFSDVRDLYWTINPENNILYAGKDLNESNLAELLEKDELEISDEANIVEEDEDYIIYFVYLWREFHVLDKSKRF